MATPSKGADRRAERTRQAIRAAFLDIVREKGMAAASVQEIADRADISRGAFYAHYADKYALIETLMREEFRRAISGLPPAWNRETLRLLIQAVLEFFRTVYRRHHQPGEIAALLERVIHEELNALILNGLQESEAQPPVSPTMLSQMMSWAIFGAAVQWSQEPAPASAQQTADDILTVLIDGVGRWLPGE
jgi:AcrR family transcriptional regulator